MTNKRDNILMSVILGGIFGIVLTVIFSWNKATKLDCPIKMARIHNDWGFEELEQACGIELSASKESCIRRLSKIHSDWRVEELRQAC
jgi:hypothetical protein